MKVTSQDVAQSERVRRQGFYRTIAATISSSILPEQVVSSPQCVTRAGRPCGLSKNRRARRPSHVPLIDTHKVLQSNKYP